MTAKSADGPATASEVFKVAMPPHMLSPSIPLSSHSTPRHLACRSSLLAMDALPYETVADAFPHLQLDRLLGGEEEPIFSIFGDSQKLARCTTLDTCPCDDFFPGSCQLSASCGLFDSREICVNSVNRYDSDASSVSEVDYSSGSQSGESLLYEDETLPSNHFSTPSFHDSSQPSESPPAQDEWDPILWPSEQASPDELFGKWGGNDTERAASVGLQQLSPGPPDEPASHNPAEELRDSSEVFDQGQDKVQLPTSTLAEAESDHGDPPRCAEAPCQAVDDTLDESLPQEKRFDGAGSGITPDPSSHQLELPKQPVGPGGLKLEDDDVVYLGSWPIKPADVRRVPGFIFNSSGKRPASEEDGIAKRRKLGTCLAVIQTVSMPDASYKWDRHNDLWRPSEWTVKRGETAKSGHELAQEDITAGRVEIRPNAYEMPIWLEWTEESGRFEGDDLDKRRRAVNLEDMRLMIQYGGRGEYLT